MITLHFHLEPQYKYELFHTNFTVMSVSLVNILHSSTPILTPSTNTSNLQKKKKTDLSHFWTRQPGTKKTNVYRKTTHTDKYLQFNSHHPSQHKPSVARTLLDRAKNVPAAETGRLSQVQHVVDALKINGYRDQFIRSSQRTIALTNHRGFVSLPYIQRTSERIARTQQFNINVPHKPVMTVGSILIKTLRQTQ